MKQLRVYIFVIGLFMINLNATCQYIDPENTYWDEYTDIKGIALGHCTFSNTMSGIKISSSGRFITIVNGDSIYKFDTLGSASVKKPSKLIFVYDPQTAKLTPKNNFKVVSDTCYEILVIFNPVKIIHFYFDTTTNNIIQFGNQSIIDKGRYRFELDSINTITYNVTFSWNSADLTSSAPPILATLFPALPAFGATDAGNGIGTNNAPPPPIQGQNSILFDAGTGVRFPATASKPSKPKTQTEAQIEKSFLSDFSDAFRDYLVLQFVLNSYKKILIPANSGSDMLDKLKSQITSIDSLCKLYGKTYETDRNVIRRSYSDFKNCVEDMNTLSQQISADRKQDSTLKSIITDLKLYNEFIEQNLDFDKIWSQFTDPIIQNALVALSDSKQIGLVGKQSEWLMKSLFSKKNNVSTCIRRGDSIQIQVEKILEISPSIHKKDITIGAMNSSIQDFFARYSTFLTSVKNSPNLASDITINSFIYQMQYANQFCTKNKDTLLKFISFMYSIDKGDNKAQSAIFSNRADVTELQILVVDRSADTFKIKAPFYTYESGFSFKRLKFDFTTGLFYNTLYSRTYYLEPALAGATPGTYSNAIIGTNPGLPFNLAIGALMNITYRFDPGWKIGISIGSSLSFIDATTQLMLGVCVIHGKTKQFCLSLGPCLGNQTLLTSAVSSNGRTPFTSNIPQGLSAVPTYTKFSLGFYASITYAIYTIP